MKVSPHFGSPELAVVMPVYNEANGIASVVEEWFAVLAKATPWFSLLAINDGSKDSTLAELISLGQKLGPRLQVIDKRNSGHGRSCRHGYELALKTGATWIFQIDSDGQCDPVYFQRFYESRATHDCIFGYRRTRDDGLGRLLISRGYRALLWLLTRSYLVDANVPYRLIRAGALRCALRRVPGDIDLQNIALTIALMREPGLRWKYWPIHFRARQGGENSINYRKIARMGFAFLRDFQRISHEDSHPRWRPDWARRRVAS
jgi:dolichol-phosphate mannosyltransferase